MTNTVTATSDFNVDFTNSFGYEVITMSHLNWQNSILTPRVPMIYWKKLAKAKLVIFTGGEDISPSIYNQVITHSYGINLERDTTELLILRYALQTHKKILGICRGHQLINAYLGGELVQDLYQDAGVIHNGAHELIPENGGGCIADIFTVVNSIHHQGVIKAGKTLLATSSYQDIIESSEGPNIITTQFHPEFLHTIESRNFFKHIKTWAKLKE